jgi:hypothetical protein
MNILSTLITGIIVAGIFAAIVISEVKKKKSGKGGCSCGCGGCEMSEFCHSKK